LVHTNPAEYPCSLVLQGDFQFKLENGGSFRAHRITLSSHDSLDDRAGVQDVICFVDTTTDEAARFAEASPEMRGPILEAARSHPGRPARLVLEAPPWMLARFNGATSHPWPPTAKDLLENQAWMNVALDVEAYGPVAFLLVTEADEVEYELPLDDLQKGRSSPMGASVASGASEARPACGPASVGTQSSETP